MKVESEAYKKDHLVRCSEAQSREVSRKRLSLPHRSTSPGMSSNAEMQGASPLMLLFCNCELSHSQQKSACKPLPSLSFPKFQQLFSVIEKGITLADGTDQGASSLLSIFFASSLNKPRLTFCLSFSLREGLPLPKEV